MMRGNKIPDNLDVAYGVEVDAKGGWRAWARYRFGGDRIVHECVTRWGAQWKARRLAKMLKGRSGGAS